MQQEKNNFNFLKLFFNQYIWKGLAWLSFSLILLLLIVLLKVNQNREGSFFFNYLLNWDFFNNSWDFANKKISVDYVNVFNSYLYMELLFSLLSTITYFFIHAKITAKKIIDQKYKIRESFDNTKYFVFKNLLFVSFLNNVTYIFCFTNAITFILVLLFWFASFMIKEIFQKKKIPFAFNSQWIKNQNKKSNLIIFVIEISYFLFKNILKIKYININFDDILKYFIPASSLALIIAVFVQMLLKNDVKKILNSINNISTQANNFQIYFFLEKSEALKNYEFVKELPFFIKKDINTSKQNENNALPKITKVSYLLTLLEEKQTKGLIQINEYNYLCYSIFYEISTNTEFEQLYKKIELIKMKKTFNKKVI